MTRDQRVELARRQLDAYNRRSIEEFLACYHEETRVILLETHEVRSTTKAELRKTYTDFFASTPNLHCVLKNRIAVGPHVIDEEWVTGIPSAPEGLHAVAIYGFRDGLIDRVWFAK